MLSLFLFFIIFFIVVDFVAGYIQYNNCKYLADAKKKKNKEKEEQHYISKLLNLLFDIL